jgi:hypothetical protein
LIEAGEAAALAALPALKKWIQDPAEERRPVGLIGGSLPQEV